MTTFNWTCPYCNHAQAVGDAKTHANERHESIADLAEGSLSACFFAIGCSNEDCKKLTIIVSVRPDKWNNATHNYDVDCEVEPLFFRRALPSSDAKPQPEYIPQALRDGYYEACLIKDDSPKAAATLARRCLQGMIRDFCNIRKATLDQEIKALHAAIDEGSAPPGVSIESVDAIDHVRRVGNIGAHMEKDINLIIPVDPQEAQSLIGLVELLFEEWYVSREQRKSRLAHIAAISAEKQKAILDGRKGTNANPEDKDISS